MRWKFCLHKGAAWCWMCHAFHCDPFVDITTLSDPKRVYFCQLCSGFKYEDYDEEEFE
ncbi:hypothetical protein [Streptomyces sp. CC53]|uniref:hypothetical protein n=1 Tax=Streptomyces sp. CC53 TaxID=1906740 RepID=UPI0015A625B6|nr:hypothetical protein [Streptomyces sp. CC53]